MNTVFLALSLLSSITGFASGYYYETTEECLYDCYFEHFGCSSLSFKESMISVEDAYDMDGANKFLLINYIDGQTVLYSKKDEKIVQTYKKDPYQSIASNFKLVNTKEEEPLLAYYNEGENSFKYVDNLIFDFESIHEYYTNQSYTYGNYYSEIALTANAHVITHASYFQKLGAKHGENTSGTCAVISSQILLGYYDTFVNDTIVGEEYDRNTVENQYGTNVDYNSFSSSPGTDDSDLGVNAFHDYLCDIATNVIHDDPTVDGMTVINQKNMIKEYLDDRGIAYSTHCSEGNPSDIVSNKAKTVIKDTIDADRPVISCGEGHCTVAFAYDDDYVWVHTGWGWVGATPWRTFESGMFFNYSAGAIDIVNICDNIHIHSDNYYAPNKDLYYCPCGATYATTDIYPSDYNLSTQYNSSESYVSFYEENVRIQNYYKRVAYIDNSFITLSARKSNAGEAYMQYWLSHRVRKITFDISYYGYSDVLSHNDSTALLWKLIYSQADNCYYWVVVTDFINENISWNTNSPTRFVFHFLEDEIYGFQFTSSAPAAGNYDSGRICIQNITIVRSTSTHNYF